MSQIEETKTAMDLIYLVSCAVNNVIPDAQRCGEMDDEAVYSLANRHMLSAAAAFALKKVMPLPNHWHNAIGNSMRRLVIYHAERSKILREFDERGIRYLPLKGIILKGIYPKPEMREMSDNDILCDREKMSEIRKLMKSMGYSCKMFGKFHHDMYYKKPVLFEMHTDLFNSVEFPEAYSYYKTYKHYSSAGTGLRSLLDVYIINKTKGQTLDRAYISREFNHFGLEDFERKVRGLSQKTFTLQPLSESDMKELSFYVNSGSYGTIDNLVISRFKHDSSIKSKRRYLLKRIFPDMRNLKVSAPVVYRHRILYPGYVVFRLVRYLAHDRSALAIELRQLKNTGQGGGNAG